MVEYKQPLQDETSRKPVPRRRARSVLRAAAIMAATAIVVAGGVWLRSTGFLVGSRPVLADFNDVSREERLPPAGHSGGLRVAVVAMISPKEAAHYYEDLVRLIGKRVNLDVTFAQKKTYDEVTRMLEQKEVDLVFSCSGPYVTAHDTFGAEILAVPVVGGKKVYYSLVLSQKNRGFKSLEDLKGKRFAFTDPQSNTGCMAPKYILAEMGQTPKSFFRETFFTHSHDNSIKAVAEGLADGAAVDSLIWEYLDAKDPKYTSQTQVIARSPAYGIPPLIVHPAMDPGLKTRLQAVLLGLHEDPAGRALLREIQIDRFERGNDSDYESVRQMQHWLERQ